MAIELVVKPSFICREVFQEKTCGTMFWLNGACPFHPYGRRATRCQGCGAALDPNYYDKLADGCPCNSMRGINHGLIPIRTCTCVICDPEQTGSVRPPYAKLLQEWFDREVKEKGLVDVKFFPRQPEDGPLDLEATAKAIYETLTGIRKSTPLNLEKL